MTDVRAVVVDDSTFMRTVITDILEDAGVDVVATAADGAEGVAAVVDLQPDVVTMDVEMPEVDGLTAVERIMDRQPTPVLMLSAHTGEGADVTFEALERGAVDFFTKPGGEVSAGMAHHEDRLVETVLSVARSDLSEGAQSRTASAEPAVECPEQTFPETPTVVVGASTGGPSVVEQVLAGIPRDAGCRILVVQHMPDGFTDRFADRLDDASAYDVSEAADGDRVGPGEAVVARGGYHLVVDSDRADTLRVSLSEAEPRHGVRPAIDVTMESAARTVEGPLAGVVLTGMGTDGAAGLSAIAERGGSTIAQDEATSVVFGMPAAAVETGDVEAVLPVDEIAEGVVDALATEVPG
ncbi:MAG: chemotaxis-specific protein-glutamate methyltransferase CheB [Halobacteriaceae archaeon]